MSSHRFVPPLSTLQTELVHGARWPVDGFESVQPGVFKASTVLFPDMAAFRARDWTRKDACIYGPHGTPTTFELEARIARLEGARHCLLCPSGLSAITLVYIALLRPGDEVLVPVNVYAANRTFLTHELLSWGVGVRLYDPTDPDTAQFTDATRLLWIEAPCSLTFEFPDVPRLAALARRRGVLSVIDNSWGAGIALRPFELGADICVHSLSKYAAGGGDTVMGSISCVDKQCYDTLKLCAMRLGLCVCAGDAASVLKGLNTLTMRYRAQDAAARFLVEPLAGHRALAWVRHPSLPDCPGHGFWRRDCTAAAGLFSLVFKEHLLQSDVDRFIDTLRLFRIGYGWGGPVSLVMPYGREVPSVQPLPGELVRFSVGLESPEDLAADLARALDQFG